MDSQLSQAYLLWPIWSHHVCNDFCEGGSGWVPSHSRQFPLKTPKSINVVHARTRTQISHFVCNELNSWFSRMKTIMGDASLFDQVTKSIKLNWIEWTVLLLSNGLWRRAWVPFCCPISVSRRIYLSVFFFPLSLWSLCARLPSTLARSLSLNIRKKLAFDSDVLVIQFIAVAIDAVCSYYLFIYLFVGLFVRLAFIHPLLHLPSPISISCVFSLFHFNFHSIKQKALQVIAICEHSLRTRSNQSHFITFYKCNYINSTLCERARACVCKRYEVLSNTNVHVKFTFCLCYHCTAHHTHTNRGHNSIRFVFPFLQTANSSAFWFKS